MRRFLSLAFASALIATAISPAARAQSPRPASPILESKKDEEKPAAPRRTRVISPEVAAALAAAAPQYAPPPPKPVPKPEDELPDARETDKPANGIVRLPKYLVLEKKPAILSERAVHTAKGLCWAGLLNGRKEGIGGALDNLMWQMGREMKTGGI